MPACLSDLAGGEPRHLHALGRRCAGWRQRRRGCRRGAAFSVLDIASGQGDLLRAIAAWATKSGF